MDEDGPIDLSDSARMRKHWALREKLEHLKKTRELSHDEWDKLHALRRDLSERHGVPPYEE